MAGKTMQIAVLSVADLAAMAAPYNPRRMKDAEMEALRRSLRFFGAVEPVVVNRRSKHIVGGHQRVKAAQAEGIGELPVVWVDLDDPSEKQLNLALNRIGGEWDEELLANVLRELDALGANVEVTGFSSDEVDRIILAALDDEDDDENENPDQPDGDGSGGAHTFQIIFDDLAQQEHFFRFVAWLRKRYTDSETVAAKLCVFIAEHAVE